MTTSFKRINSAGTPMSEVHMVNALVWSTQFDLLARIDELAESLKPAGWGDFEQQMILNICKARLDVALYDEEAEVLAAKLKARPDVLLHVRDDIVKVAGVLDEIAGVRGPVSLPYAYQAVLLADALRDVEDPHAAPELLDKLRRWFWATTLGEYFGGMTKALFERARQHLHEMVRGSAGPYPPDLMPVIIDPVRRFDFRSARSRAIALLLAEQKPRIEPLVDPGDSSFDLLAQFGSDAMCRLFSEHALDERDREAINGPENRFLVHPKLSRAFREALCAGEPRLDDDILFESHAIDPEARLALHQSRVGDFLRLRRARLEQIERTRATECGLDYREHE